MSQLLVSVRSVVEARVALRNGAGLIDVKEPANGALGRADQTTIDGVVRCIAGRLPVSAAMGELDVDSPESLPSCGLSYVKFGLAGWRGSAWRRALRQVQRLVAPDCRLVAVAYVDWRRAGSPSPEAVCDFACTHACGAFLLDTWEKDGSTLPDWLPSSRLRKLMDRCRQDGVAVALAGSLGLMEIERLRDLEPDWFAVRGAVCRGGVRSQSIDGRRVRRLAASVSIAIPAG